MTKEHSWKDTYLASSVIKSSLPSSGRHINDPRIHADEDDSEKPLSINTTPPLEPEVSMSSPEKDYLSRTSTRSSNRSDKSFKSITQSLKENWAAGVDRKHYLAKQAESDRSTPSSSALSRSTTHSSSPSYSSISSRDAKVSAKAHAEQEKARRLMERQESQRKQVKLERDAHLASLSQQMKAPRHAPLNMLAAANDGRAQDMKRYGLNEEEERRRSGEEHREAEYSYQHGNPYYSPKTVQHTADYSKSRSSRQEQAYPNRRSEQIRASSDLFAPSPSRPVRDDTFLGSETLDARGTSMLQRSNSWYNNPKNDPRPPTERSCDLRTYLNYQPDSSNPGKPRFPWHEETAREPATGSRPHPYPRFSQCEDETQDDYMPARHRWGNPSAEPDSSESPPQERGEYESILSRITMQTTEGDNQMRNIYRK